MSLPVPETFVRRRPSTNTSVHSFESEAKTLRGKLDLCNGDISRNVHQGQSSLDILSDSQTQTAEVKQHIHQHGGPLSKFQICNHR